MEYHNKEENTRIGQDGNLQVDVVEPEEKGNASIASRNKKNMQRA